MTAKPKPLTREEWEDGQCDGDWNIRLHATLDALFRYRERTRGGIASGDHCPDMIEADDIAAEEGIE